MPTRAARRNLSARTLGHAGFSMPWPGQTASGITSPCRRSGRLGTVCVRHPAGVWLREDCIQAVDFAYLTAPSIPEIRRKVMMCGQDYEEEGRVDWSATLCQMDETTHGRKIYSKLFLRADMEQGSWLRVEISRTERPSSRCSSPQRAGQNGANPHPAHPVATTSASGCQVGAWSVQEPYP